MNLIRYSRIFICVVLATTFSVIDNSSALSAECTTKDSSGHCVKVPGNHRKGGKSRNDQGKKEDVPSNDNNSTEPVDGSYNDWMNEIRQTHRVNKDSGGVDYYAPLDGNNICYTEEYRPGKQKYSEYALEDGMAVQTLKRGDGFELSKFCKPNDAKTFTSNDPAQPKGPTIEEMLQEVED